MSRSKKLRGLIAATMSLLAGSVFAQPVTVVEFYNKPLDAYFITGRADEQKTLDAMADFRRTGMTFDAVSATGSATTLKRVCRFYINLSSPPTSSHFYGREGEECEQIQARNLPGFNYEGFDFAVAQPQGGVCPTGTNTVYRAFRPAAGGKTPNHRYTTSPETYNFAQSQGYVAEDAVFCAINSTDVTPTLPASQKCGTFYYPSLQISYQSLTDGGTADGFQRYVNSAKETFNGQIGSTAVVEVRSGTPPLMTYISDGAASWAMLGTRVSSDSGNDDMYYANPPIFPRDYLPGQPVFVNSQLTYSKPNALGIVYQSGSVTYIGPESVAVPYGSFLSTCKFYTQLVTSSSGTGDTTTSSILTWVADRFGIVKTIISTETTSPSKPVSRVSTTTEAVFLKPL